MAEEVGYTALTESATDVGPRALHAVLRAADQANRSPTYDNKAGQTLGFIVVLETTLTPTHRVNIAFRYKYLF